MCVERGKNRRVGAWVSQHATRVTAGPPQHVTVEHSTRSQPISLVEKYVVVSAAGIYRGGCVWVEVPSSVRVLSVHRKKRPGARQLLVDFGRGRVRELGIYFQSVVRSNPSRAILYLGWKKKLFVILRHLRFPTVLCFYNITIFHLKWFYRKSSVWHIRLSLSTVND